MNIAATSAIAVFSDEASDRAIEREAMEVTAWIKSHLHRARTLRTNARFFVTGTHFTREISFEDWPLGEKDFYKPSNEFIGFGASGDPDSIYNYLHQTMTPSFKLSIRKKTNNGSEYAHWYILISGRGYVTLNKDP
jgi:hypothetical protein